MSARRSTSRCYDSLIVLNHHAATTATALGRTVLHGGAVDIAGRAIVVVGHSGAGKSTLTAALTRAGHAYLADEVVAIDDDLVVDAFHRPLGLRSGGLTALGLDIPAGPVRLHLTAPRRTQSRRSMPARPGRHPPPQRRPDRGRAP